MRQKTIPDLTQVRGWMRDLLTAHRDTGKSVVLLAVDGVRYIDAEQHWRKVDYLHKITSIYPTTSSSCWLSAMTGERVEQHGCVGVVFRPHLSADMINVFTHPDGLSIKGEKNIFHDAAELGYQSIALSSDLGAIKCGWRERLLNGAHITPSSLHFHEPCSVKAPIDMSGLLFRLNQDLENIASRPEQTYGWIFLDLDQYIHIKGYDLAVQEYLSGVDHIAEKWAHKGLVIAAHSDHGLVETNHSAVLEKYLNEIIERYKLEMGGAGRTRWLYVPESVDIHSLMVELQENIPEDVQVAKRSDYFSPTEKIKSRVGEILLIARSSRFLADAGLLFDHGSLAKDEWEIPFAVWGDS